MRSETTRHQLFGVRAFTAVGTHVVHFAVVAGFEPALQVLLMLGQVEAADADLLKAQLAAPVLDGLGEGGQVCGNSGHETRETGAEVRIILPDIGARRRMLHTKDELPDALYSAAQVRALDASLIAAGTAGFELMQRAARATWRALVRQWPTANELSVLAGHGNNAGDGYLVAVLALRAGWSVRVVAVGDPQRLQGDAALAHAEAVSENVLIEPWTAQSGLRGIVLDALLGTGLSGDVREPYASAIAAINASGLSVAAVDIPSGLCADTGRILGHAVHADLTVTFIGLKVGLFTGDAADVTGELVFNDLQADQQLLDGTAFTARRLSIANLPRLASRAPASHKGKFGHVLLIGGDRGYGGAILLSAQSALRSGAGMVSLSTRPEHVSSALSRIPEAMVLGTSSANQLMGLLEKVSVLVVGPGLGQAGWGRSLLSAAANAPLPQVWDADALNLLAGGQVNLPRGCVITPHPGEAARLLGVSTADVQSDRPAAAHALSKKYTAVVVLKGAGSLIAHPDGRLALCHQGHPAMATAGLGDVLAGLLGALLAQGMQPFDAACLAVWLHANAGAQLGKSGRGLAASDLIPAIRQLLEEQAPCLK
jgi:NAD(P)H-hydrate epimerase